MHLYSYNPEENSKRVIYQKIKKNLLPKYFEVK